MSRGSSSPEAPSTWGRALGLAGGVGAVLVLLVVAFTWPAARSEASDLSIAVTGEAELVGAFTAGLEGGLGDVVELVETENREAVVTGIEEREYVGGVILVQGSPEVLTASAGGQVPSAFMTALAARLQATLDAQVYAGVTGGLAGAVQVGADPSEVLSGLPETLPTVVVTDVVPLSEGDANGVGITAAGIPLTVGALLAGIAIAFTVTGIWRRLAAVASLAVIGGLGLTVILNTWLQVYPGAFWVVWLALSLSLLATSSLFVGLHSALGRAGLGVGAVLTLFAGMPWAAFAVPSAFLPAGLGQIGQWFIPGATATLTRTISYFPDASAAGAWWVVVLWAAVGTGLILVRRVRTSTGPVQTPRSAT